MVTTLNMLQYLSMTLHGVIFKSIPTTIISKFFLIYCGGSDKQQGWGALFWKMSQMSWIGLLWVTFSQQKKLKLLNTILTSLQVWGGGLDDGGSREEESEEFNQHTRPLVS